MWEEMMMMRATRSGSGSDADRAIGSSEVLGMRV